MKKTIQHNDQSITIEIELDSKVELRPGGKREHFFKATNQIGDKILDRYVNAKQALEAEVELFEIEVRQLVDDKGMTESEKTLQSLGYE